MYLVAILYFVTIIQQDLSNRPLMIYNLSQRRSALIELCFWSNENNIQNQSYSLKYNYKNSNTLPSPEIGIANARNFMHKTKQLIVDPDLERLYSSAVNKMVFDHVANAIDALYFGTLTSSLFLTSESYYFEDLNSFATSEEITNYYNQTKEISDAIKTVYQLVDVSSKDVINYFLNLFIYYVVIFCATLIALFFLFYNPFLNYEARVLVYLKKLMTVIPVKYSKYSKTGVKTTSRIEKN